MKLLIILLTLGLVSGCATSVGSPYVTAGQTISASGSVYGVPVSGGMRVGANQNGVYLQPNLSMRAIRFSR